MRFNLLSAGGLSLPCQDPETVAFPQHTTGLFYHVTLLPLSSRVVRGNPPSLKYESGCCGKSKQEFCQSNQVVSILTRKKVEVEGIIHFLVEVGYLAATSCFWFCHLICVAVVNMKISPDRLQVVRDLSLFLLHLCLVSSCSQLNHTLGCLTPGRLDLPSLI